MVEVCFVMSLFVVCLTTLLATPVIQSQMTDRLAMVQIMYPQIERHEGPVAREGKRAKRTKILRLFLFFLNPVYGQVVIIINRIIVLHYRVEFITS